MIAWADDYVIANGTSGGVLIFEPCRFYPELDEIRRTVDDYAPLTKRHTARVRWAADAAAIEPLPPPPPPRPAPRVRRRACSVASRYRVAA